MRSQLKVLLIFLIAPALSFGQITITGKVVDAEELELPGVWINEAGTSNKVMTDFDGNYKIVVSDTATILEFSSVGYMSRIVPINGQTEINTSLKEYVTYDAFDQRIGLFLQSGLVHTPYGARLYFSTPIVGPFSVGIQGAYMTDFKSNKRFDANLSLSSYRFLLRPDTWLYGYIDLNYRKLNIENNIDLVSYSIENNINFYGNHIILGLGKMEYAPEYPDNNSGYGIIVGYQKSFQKLDFLALTYKMGFYKEAIEYQLQMDVPIKRLEILASFNKIGDYHEIMLGIGFKTYYYYRYQNNANKY